MTAGRSSPGTPAIAGSASLRSLTEGEAGLVPSAATAISIAVAAAGATLLVRRLGGGFALPPSPALAWAVAVGGIPLVLAVESGSRLTGERWPVWLARAGLVAAALALAPLADAAAWTSRAIGLGGTMVALITALRPPLGWRPPTLHGWPRPGRIGGPGRTGAVAAMAPAAAAPEARGAAGESLPAGFRQRLERYETAAGDDCVRGQVMLSVPVGSRTGHAHVGFCPAFATLPSVEVATECDFVEAEVMAAEVLPWGIRVECRLSEPAEEPLEIPVTIRAIRQA